MNRQNSIALGRGMTLVEISAAVAILAVLLGSTVQVMRVLGLQQRAAVRHTVALETAQALVEELANTPWDELTPAAAERLVVPNVVQDYLPGAKLVARITEEATPVAAKRLTVELTWTAPNGQPAAPVRLTAWSYRDATLTP